MEMESFSLNEIVINELLCSVGHVLLAKAAKSIAFFCFLMGYLPNSTTVLPKEPDTIAEFPIIDLHAVSKPGAQNTDASESEDDDDEDAGDDQDEEAGDEEDASGDEVEGKENAKDVPSANGDGASEDEDDDDDEEEEEKDDDDEDDDDDDGDDDGDEETEDEEEDEEEDEDTPQPPAKRRK